LCCHTSFSQHSNGTGIKDKLLPLQPAAVKIDGYLGGKIDQCIHNRLMVQNVDTLIDIFSVRQNDNFGFNGEFFGKWAAAAALAYYYQPDKDLKQKMDKATARFIGTRSADGYITTYKKGDEFKVWDVWNQKYVLLGLIAQYDVTGKKEDLNAAKSSADHLMVSLGPGKPSLEEYGPAIHKGGVNYSILEPIVLLYERSGEKKYLDYANYIVDSWSKPGKYSKTGARLIENAEAGIPLVDSEVLHSYVLMSCFEGLCELYRVTGQQRYLDASIKVAQSIKKYELMIDGSLSNHEMWYNGALEQTEMLEMPSETCATATWMKLCYQLLRLTGESRWADELEVSLYNGLLSAMMPKGQWWAYNSPLSGERVPSRQQGSLLSCCVSSGPRGLLITPQWGMMTDAEGPVINLYAPGSASYLLAGRKKVTITQSTDYPMGGLITFAVQPEKTSSFTVRLRIPEWSKKTVLKVNGQEIPFQSGSYASIQREWKKDDQITLELDMRGRIIRAPSGAPQQAVMRGPVVLALDNRLVPEQVSTVWLIAQPYQYDNLISKEGKGYILPKHNFPPAGEQGYIELKPIPSPDKNIRMAFEASFFVRPVHFLAHQEKKLILCDLASAGNTWSAGNLYKVWLPQPMYMGNMYPKGAGQVLVNSKRNRPEVPPYIDEAVATKE
jgi:DUF1680 family protein